MNEDQFEKDIRNPEKFSKARLAEMLGPMANTSARKILLEKEFERRERIEQHELDLQLIERQVRWMKFAVIATILSALLGVILGAYLQRNWPADQQQKPTQSIKEEIPVSPLAHPVTTNISKSSSETPKKK